MGKEHKRADNVLAADLETTDSNRTNLQSSLVSNVRFVVEKAVVNQADDVSMSSLLQTKLAAQPRRISPTTTAEESQQYCRQGKSYTYNKSNILLCTKR